MDIKTYRLFQISELEVCVIVPLLIFPSLIWILLNLGQGILSFVSIIYIIFYLYFLTNYRFRKIAFSWPLCIWLILTAYHLVNASLKEVPEINYVDYLRGFKCYASICIFTLFFSQKANITFKVIFYSLLVWQLIVLCFAEYSPGERLSINGIVSVTIGKNAAIMATAGIFWSIMERKNIKTVVYKVIFPVIIILLAQTRNAFGFVLIMLMGYYYSEVMKCKLTIKHLILSLICVIFAFFSLSVMIENTGLGDRFSDDFKKVNENTYKTTYQTGTIFDYVVGERIIYYYTGWEIFMKHPWTGIGLDNYQNYMQGAYPMHVEYMTHLAEGGIIAATLWMLFIISLFVVISRAKISKQKKSMAYFTMGAIIFTCFFSVMYEQELQMMLYAIILSINYPSRGNFFNTKSTLFSALKKKYEH